MKGLIRDLRQQYGDDIKKLLPKMREQTVPDRGKLADAERRGAAAERLLEDSDLKRVLEAVESFYLNAWRQSAVGEVELREKAHVAVNVIDGIRNQLRSELAAGEAAAKELDRLNHQ